MIEKAKQNTILLPQTISCMYRGCPVTKRLTNRKACLLTMVKATTSSSGGNPENTDIDDIQYVLTTFMTFLPPTVVSKKLQDLPLPVDASNDDSVRRDTDDTLR